MKITIIGAGNVATQLAVAFHEAGHQIVQIYSRTFSDAKRLAIKVASQAIANLSDLNSADLYILAVNDDSLIELAAKLRLPDKLVVHTSGMVPISILNKVSQHHGSCYPLQTLRKEIAVDLQTVPFLIEAADLGSSEQLVKLVRTISQQVKVCTSGERQLIHLAAVVANNFTTHLIAEGKKFLQKHHLDPQVLNPLIIRTMENALTEFPENGQTGPAIRGDRQTIAAHLSLLKDEPDLKAIYSLITEAISAKLSY